MLAGSKQVGFLALILLSCIANAQGQDSYVGLDPPSLFKTLDKDASQENECKARPANVSMCHYVELDNNVLKSLEAKELIRLSDIEPLFALQMETSRTFEK